MQYLLGQMVMCLLLAGLVGLAIGWIWWGMGLRKARERATDLEQRVSKLSGYPARLTDVEATHAAFVASKNEEDAKTKARIAELELAAAKVPLLEKSLAAKTTEAEGLATWQTKFVDLDVRHKTLAGELEGKDAQVASLTSRVAELEKNPSAAEMAALQKKHGDLDWQIKTLEDQLKAKEAQIAEHEAAHSEKDAQISGLSSKVAELGLTAGTLTTLALEHKELQGQLQAKDALIADHEAAHSYKDARLASLTARVGELEQTADQLTALASEHKQLQGQLATKDALIAEHEAAQEDKDARLATLASRLAVAEQAAQKVPLLEKKVDYHADANKEKDEHIEQLLSQVDDLKAEVAHKDAQMTYLDERATELKAQLDEKESHVGALLSRVDELQPAVASDAELKEKLESTQYEHNLTLRKLQMAETGLVAHQAEIAKLNDQLLQQKAAPAMKTMAAAAGVGFATAAAVSHFYDVNEGNPAPVVVSETAKRLEELSKAAAAKDAEITALKSKIAEFEAAPDPDAKRQILYTAKAAELTNLKGVVNTLLQPVNHDEIAQRAYFHAQSRGFKGGSPKEDWYRAERDVHYGRLAYVWESTQGGTMY